MSYYYQYYLGIKDKEGIKPFGPYDCNGKLYPIIERSRSFASDLHDDFYVISDNLKTEKLIKELGYEDCNGNIVAEVKYLPFNELPNGDYIKSGYFLIEDVKSWEKDKYNDDLFYNMISPDVYAELLRNELTFGKNVFDGEVEDESEKEELSKGLNASDYMRFAAPDYSSKEYEAELIRQVALMFDDWDIFHGKEPAEMVILETEG